ncbi:MAG: TlpA disulfide reductase family protein [Anaerolineae bacterium]|nr:TlpA family protein disulfide reductase [Thermoflexales bacterium]MDW8406574.1 TlpA disulfide reductase family protein [Anaerolineae bacterium]
MAVQWLRRLALAAVVLGGLWTWISRPEAHQVGVADAPAPRVGVPAPDFTLPALRDAQLIRLSDLRGRIVVLNFWATWCPPCRVEMPALHHVQHSIPDVVVVGVNQQESVERVDRFMREQALDFPIALDVQGEVNRLYRVRALPTTFFIDRAGVIRDIVYGGPLTKALIESKVSALR